MRMALPEKRIGSIGVLLVCLDICKGQHVLILQWRLINAKDSIMIHTFHMKEQLSVLAYIYWIQETRELFIDLILNEVYSAMLMLIFLVDRKMAITTVRNQYCHVQVLS